MKFLSSFFVAAAALMATQCSAFSVAQRRTMPTTRLQGVGTDFVDLLGTSATSAEATKQAIMSNTAQLPQEGLIGIAAATIAVIGGFWLTSSMGTNSKSGVDSNGKKREIVQEKTVKPDVSIPYNAAALLAYDEWRGNDVFDQQTFKKFEALYIEKTVAEVTGKKIARDKEEALSKLKEIAKKAKEELASLKGEPNGAVNYIQQ